MLNARTLLRLMGVVAGLCTSPFALAQIVDIPGVGDVAGANPTRDYKMLETEHFRITFADGLAPEAEKVGTTLEAARLYLMTWLKWNPPGMTPVFLLDNTDAANGFSSANLRIGMVLYVTPPDNWLSLYHYDDWLKLLATHEYLHFVNMDTVVGFWQIVRTLFGYGIVPNALWPTWMLEGLAVYAETRLTTGGRGRSPYYDMIGRTLIEDRRFKESSFKGPRLTLDRAASGDFPYYPSGEMPYFFGYSLFNQVAGDKGEDALGEMSYRSARRVPYFINGNLENITGKDWEAYWKEWVASQVKRQEESLAILKSTPVTSFERITEAGFEALGCSASPNGEKLAFTWDSLDVRTGLFVRDLKSGKTRKVSDKLLGVGHAFTSDSRFVIASGLKRYSPWRIESDLLVFDTENGSSQTLSYGLRAKDPDLSPDGKTLVFTLVDSVTVGLATAPLIRSENGTGDHFELGPIEKLFFPARQDRLSNPKWSKDGKQIYFTWHPNGKNEENLWQITVDSKATKQLVSNGHYQRFPAVDSEGKLHFVSDLNGVDNLYRYDPSEGSGAQPKPVTHLTSGVWLPCFGPGAKTYGSVFSSKGFDLAELQTLPKERTAALPKIPEINAPASYLPPEVPTSGTTQAEIKDYSPWPSLAPRAWAPYFFLGPKDFYLAGYALGFDAVDRYRYWVSLGYGSETAKPDTSVTLSYRKLGPTLSLYGSQTHYVSARFLSDSSPAQITESNEAAAQLTYNFKWTFSSLTPLLKVSVVKEINHDVKSGANSGSDVTPMADLSLGYAGYENTRLGLFGENGRQISTGVRTYFEPDRPTVKAIYTHSEFIRITDHSVLVPRVSAAAVNRRSQRLLGGNVLLNGRSPLWFRASPQTSLSGLGLRGFPGQSFLAGQAGQFALDYRFPIARILRGLGTSPLWLSNLTGFAFGESTWIPEGVAGPGGAVHNLTAWGGGLQWSIKLFYQVPLLLSAEYHRGLQTALGGRGEVFLAVNLGTLPF